MTIKVVNVAMLVYLTNQLVRVDPAFTAGQAAAAAEDGMTRYLIQKGKEKGLDTSYLEMWSGQNDNEAILDDALARWTNAGEAADYGLPSEAGWLWVSGMLVDMAFVHNFRDREVEL